MKLIVGLGNPGKKYKYTRHNLGFLVIEALSKVIPVSFNRKSHRSLFGRIKYKEDDLIFAMPRTYMNNSGSAVSSFITYYKINPRDVLVICDDVNLPFGRLRFRTQGSHGGHNGLCSIIDYIGDDFVRLRIGIGQPSLNEIEYSQYVLSEFSKAEKIILEKVIQQGVEALVCYLDEGVFAAMNKFNGKEISA